MLYREVNEDDWNRIKQHVHSSFPIVQAVIDRSQQGRIYMSGNGDYWVLHKAGFSELFLTTDDGTAWINFLMSEKKLPRYFHVYAPDEKVMNVVKENLNTFSLRERERVQLSCDILTERPVSLPDGYWLENVNHSNFTSLSVFNLELETKFWRDTEDFISHALGIVAIDENGDPVALCYAAAIANDLAEIDVITLEKFRGKGLAKLVVRKFIGNLGSFLKPNWDCFAYNASSLNTAITLNFVEKNRYNFVSIFKKEPQ